MHLSSSVDLFDIFSMLLTQPFLYRSQPIVNIKITLKPIPWETDLLYILAHFCCSLWNRGEGIITKSVLIECLPSTRHNNVVMCYHYQNIDKNLSTDLSEISKKAAEPGFHPALNKTNLGSCHNAPDGNKSFLLSVLIICSFGISISISLPGLPWFLLLPFSF